MTAERVERLRERLVAALSPCEVTVIDEGHLHIGHEGARDGRGHFRVRVVSDRFDGLPKVLRHRLIYEAVGDMMETDIHALGVEALTTVESDRG